MAGGGGMCLKTVVPVTTGKVMMMIEMSMRMRMRMMIDEYEDGNDDD